MTDHPNAHDYANKAEREAAYRAEHPRQAKDIPDEPVLAFLGSLGSYATWFEGEPTSVLNAMPAGTPPKVALAKMRSMIKRGLVEGCPCGCRGDFRLPAK